jgi:hypothetical protein
MTHQANSVASFRAIKLVDNAARRFRVVACPAIRDSSFTQRQAFVETDDYADVDGGQTSGT